MSLRDQLKAKPVVKKLAVEIGRDENDQPIMAECRGMTGESRAAFVEFLQDQGVDEKSDARALNLRDYYPKVLIGNVFDPADGSPLFQAGDEDFVNAQGAAAQDEMTKAVLRLSGLDKESRDAAAKKPTSTESTAS